VSGHQVVKSNLEEPPCNNKRTHTDHEARDESRSTPLPRSSPTRWALPALARGPSRGEGRGAGSPAHGAVCHVLPATSGPRIQQRHRNSAKHPQHRSATPRLLAATSTPCRVASTIIRNVPHRMTCAAEAPMARGPFAAVKADLSRGRATVHAVHGPQSSRLRQRGEVECGAIIERNSFRAW